MTGEAQKQDSDVEKEPGLEEMQEPSTEKDPGSEPKVDKPVEPEVSHQAVGIGVIDSPAVAPEQAARED